LIRRVYGDDDVVRIGRVLYPKGVFGFQCSLERAIEEIRSYNDFAIHRVFTVDLHVFFPFYLTVLKFLTILPHVLFFLQLLVSYGDNGTKGALSDDDVLSSAKCQVQYNKLLFIPFNMFV
jgi:SWI/SNF-related matrix-associated actin-dependent regulator of chromatin subfamily A containing DEAD/H box 1